MESAGTLGTDVYAWDKLFELHCKAPNFFVAKALPALRRTIQPRVVVVAQAPVCQPESLAFPAVPYAVVSQLRGMYIIGMNEEFGHETGIILLITGAISYILNAVGEKFTTLHMLDTKCYFSTTTTL